MKKKLLLASFLAAFTAPLQADVLVESNLTIALKFYFNQAPEVETPKFTTRKYTTTTIKNIDLINAYTRVNGGNFSKKAKLIKVDRCDGENGEILSTRFYIRDNGADTEITALFDLGQESDDIKSYKISKANNTETGSYLQVVTLQYLVPDPNTDDDEFIYASGLEKATRKTIIYQEEFATLLASGNVVNGNALFQSSSLEVPMEGVIQGTIKFSAPKAVSLVN